MLVYQRVPSGKHTKKKLWKSPFSIGKSNRNGPCSRAMSDYRRVYIRSPYIAMAKRPSSQTFMSFFIIGVPILQVEGGERLQIKWQSLQPTPSGYLPAELSAGRPFSKICGTSGHQQSVHWRGREPPLIGLSGPQEGCPRHGVAWVGLA
jgi:hypothetical protein